MKILFVCTGNTCRSVMAHGLLQKMLEEKAQQAERGSGEDEQITIASAGLAALEGQPATPEALAQLQEEGVDFSHHRARRVTREMLEEADLVLAMTRSHLASLQQHFPDFQEKIWLFSRYCLDREEDIPDPFGIPGSYKTVSGKLKEGIQALVGKLQQLNYTGGDRSPDEQ